MNTQESKKLARFWLILASLLALFVAMPEFYDDVAGRTAGGLALLHQMLRWVFVDTIGAVGAVIFIMACGALAAWLSWPKNGEQK